MDTSAFIKPMSQRTRHGPIKVRPTKFEGKAEVINFEDLDLASFLEPWPTDVPPEPLDPKAEGWRELGEPPLDPDNLQGLPEAECDARAQPLRLSRKPKRRLPWPMPYRPEPETLSIEPWMTEPFPAEMPWDKQDHRDIICRDTDKLTMVRWEEYPLYDENEAETYDKVASLFDYNTLPINKPHLMTRRFPKERLARKETITSSELHEHYETTKKHNAYQKFMLDEFHTNSFRSPKAFYRKNTWDKMKTVEEEEGGVNREDGEGGENERSRAVSEWGRRGRGGSTIGLRGAFRGRGRGGGGWRDGGVGRGSGREYNTDEGVEEEEELNDEDKEVYERLGRDDFKIWKKTDNFLKKIEGDCEQLENTNNYDEGKDNKNEQ